GRHLSRMFARHPLEPPGVGDPLGHCYGEQRRGKLRRAEGQHVAVLVTAVVILLAKVTLGVAFGSAWGASHGARTVVLALVHALAPGPISDILQLVNRVLPEPGPGEDALQSATGP